MGPLYSRLGNFFNKSIRVKKEFLNSAHYAMHLCLLTFSPLIAQEHFFYDGDHLQVPYSEKGPTLIKVKGAKIKQILDSGHFDKFVTDDKSNLFLSDIKSPQAFFLVFEGDQTLCLELTQKSTQAQQTHELHYKDLNLEPDLIARALDEGKNLKGFETKISLENYQTQTFALKRILEYESPALLGQKIKILNMTNKIQNFSSLQHQKELISFYSKKSTLHPGESTDVIILFKKS